jgi:hypothetical protein
MCRTSVFLYYKTQAAGEANKRTVCEGELTLLRSRVVGNKNLFKVAQQLELGNFSQSFGQGSFRKPCLQQREKSENQWFGSGSTMILVGWIRICVRKADLDPEKS